MADEEPEVPEEEIIPSDELTRDADGDVGIMSYVPDIVVFEFKTRRCFGNPEDEYKRSYAIIFDIEYPAGVGIFLSSIREPGSTLTEEDKKKRIKVYHETALALFSEEDADIPSNDQALIDLTKKILFFHLNWNRLQFDLSYTTILDILPYAYVDTYEFTYLPCQVGTRFYSRPFNWEVERLMHHDPANADCKDDPETDLIVSKEPCIEFYGPPAKCVGGKPELTRYKVCLVNGLLKQEYVQKDTLE